MDEPRFTPELFSRRPAIAQVDTELRRWLRTLPVAQRIVFLVELYTHNYRYAIKLMRASQLPFDEVILLLQHWLLLPYHNCSRGLIEGIVPMIGEARFWMTAAKLELDPTMAEFLNYYGCGKLNHYRALLASRRQP